MAMDCPSSLSGRNRTDRRPQARLGERKGKCLGNKALCHDYSIKSICVGICDAGRHCLLGGERKQRAISKRVNQIIALAAKRKPPTGAKR